MRIADFDRVIRGFVPSLGKASYNPIVKTVGNTIASVLGLPFRELRQLPPNHLRLRVGVGNRVLTNHVNFIERGRLIWLEFLSHQYCTSKSDVVELGCGCGRIARGLKDGWFEGSYLGVDIDTEMIEYCRNNFAASRFQFLLSPHKSKTYSPNGGAAHDARQVSLSLAEPDSKDFVFSISLYSHLLEAEFAEYLGESFRILRSGGWMYLSFFCMEDVDLGQRWTFTHRRGNAFIENDDFPEAAVAYEKAYVVRLVESWGFREVAVIPHALQTVLIARK